MDGLKLPEVPPTLSTRIFITIRQLEPIETRVGTWSSLQNAGPLGMGMNPHSHSLQKEGPGRLTRPLSVSLVLAVALAEVTGGYRRTVFTEHMRRAHICFSLNSWASSHLMVPLFTNGETEDQGIHELLLSTQCEFNPI